MTAYENINLHIFPQRAWLQELGNEILKLVSYGATPEQWAGWLRVPLEHAAARGNLDLVNNLLDAGADGSAGWRGCRGRTLLHAAAVGGNPDVLTALLGAGAYPDVNVVSMSPKRSALYVATVCGHEDVARRLVLAGADVRFEDPMEQRSVLHEAASGGHEQLVNELLMGGADVNSISGPLESTPLHRAAAGGHTGIVSALLLRGANKDALDRNRATPLMWAADSGQVAAIETLEAAGADLSIRDEDGASALDWAVSYAGHIPFVKAILRHGVDVNSRDSDGWSALHTAASYNQAEYIGALFEAGADIELRTTAEETPLMAAAYSSSGESLLALVNRGAAVMMRNDTGETALHRACFGKCPGLKVVVDILLRCGADESALDDHGRTPADFLDLAPDRDERRCSQEEIERVRLSLARAPADRAWRRRCWLVMLRSRAPKASGESRESHGAGGVSGGTSDTHVVGVGEETKCPSTSGCDGSRGGDVGGNGQACDNNGGDGAGVAAGGGGLSRLVDVLLGLELEGVFRVVVAFL